MASLTPSILSWERHSGSSAESGLCKDVTRSWRDERGSKMRVLYGLKDAHAVRAQGCVSMMNGLKESR